MSAKIIPFPRKITHWTELEFPKRPKLPEHSFSAVDLSKAISKAADKAAKEGVEKHKIQRQAYYDALGINIALEALYPLTTRGKNDTRK